MAMGYRFALLFAAAAVAGLVTAAADSARAAMVTLSQPTIDTMQQGRGGTPAVTTVVPSPTFGGEFTKFVTTFTPETLGVEGRKVVRLRNPVVDFDNSDEFKLQVTNSDENDWKFRLVIKDDSDNKSASSLESLSLGQTTIFALSLAGLDLDNLRRIALVVKGDLPRDLLGDVTAEYNVAAVPLPPAVWLFGSALLGLIAISRRRRA